MLTKVLALVLVVLIGLALGIETARYVHVHATGVVSTGAVNIHHALGFGLLATSGALLLSLSWEWFSRHWTRFTVWFELTLDGLFDFDELDVVLQGDDAKRLLVSLKNHASPEEMARRRQISRERLANPFVDLTQKANDGLLPCRGCSWCGIDPGDLPDELWTECNTATGCQADLRRSQPSGCSTPPRQGVLFQRPIQVLG